MERFAVKQTIECFDSPFCLMAAKRCYSVKYGEGIFIRFSAFYIHIAYGVENKRFAVKAG